MSRADAGRSSAAPPESAPGELASIVPTRVFRAQTKRRRQTYTFLVVIGTVLLIGAGALGNWLHWWSLGPHGPSVSCPAQTVSDPSLTGVNVYNGTDRHGLAAAVAKELQHRGFVVGSVATEHESAPIKEVALIRYGSSGRIAAHTLSLEFPGPVKKVKIKRRNDTVDVVLGQKYAGLATRAVAARAVRPLPASPGCALSEGPEGSPERAESVADAA